MQILSNCGEIHNTVITAGKILKYWSSTGRFDNMYLSASMKSSSKHWRTRKVAVTCEWRSLFLVQYCFTGLVQRIFNCNKIHDVDLTSYKVLNSYYGTPCFVIIYTSYKLLNMVRSLWPAQ